MKSKKKSIIFAIYSIVFIFLVTFTILPNEFREIESTSSIERIVDVDKEKLFNLMADLEKYPSILPENFIAISIKNTINNTIFTQETIQESGVKITLNVKHTIIPYETQIIEILDGDAKGTKITVIFTQIDSKTKVNINTEVHLKGVLAPFGYLPQSNIHSAIGTVLESFVDYINKENS